MARPYLPSLFGRDGDTIGSLFRDVEKVFEDFNRRGPLGGPPAAAGAGLAMTPKIDISEGKDAIEITAELPGVDENDIDVSLNDGVLTLRGEKKSERKEEDKDKNWHVVERSYGAFSRSIALPYDPDPSQVDAKFEKGVLRVKLPKPPEKVASEKKIPIKAG